MFVTIDSLSDLVTHIFPSSFIFSCIDLYFVQTPSFFFPFLLYIQGRRSWGLHGRPWCRTVNGHNKLKNKGEKREIRNLTVKSEKKCNNKPEGDSLETPLFAKVQQLLCSAYIVMLNFAYQICRTKGKSEKVKKWKGERWNGGKAKGKGGQGKRENNINVFI